MAIALSGGNLVYAEFDAHDNAAAVEYVNTALTRAGMSSVATSDGYRVTGIGPQGIGNSAHIFTSGQDGLSSPYNTLAVQFESIIDTSRKSNIKRITCTPTKRLRIIANRCRFWLYTPGESSNQYGNVIGGGTAWTSQGGMCHGTVSSTTPAECWWATGDYGFDALTTPRGAALAYLWVNDNGTRAQGIGGSDGCYNGVLSLGAARWMCLTIAGQTRDPILFKPVYYPNVPMKIEPLISWPLPTDDGTFETRVFAQDYDAWWRTDTCLADTVFHYDGADWVGFTDDYRYGAYHLMTPTIQTLEEPHYCH